MHNPESEMLAIKPHLVQGVQFVLPSGSVGWSDILYTKKVAMKKYQARIKKNK